MPEVASCHVSMKAAGPCDGHSRTGSPATGDFNVGVFGLKWPGFRWAFAGSDLGVTVVGCMVPSSEQQRDYDALGVTI